MKLLITLALVLFAFSSFAKECEMEVVLAADASHVLLNLTEKDVAAPDGEFVELILGSKREQSDCEELAKKLELRDLKVLIEDTETPVKIVNLSKKPIVPLLND